MLGTEPVIKAIPKPETLNPLKPETQKHIVMCDCVNGTEPVIKASLVWDISPGISPSKGISASNAISRSKGTRSPQQSPQASTVRARTSTSPTTVCGISAPARGRANAQGRRMHARMYVCVQACIHVRTNQRTNACMQLICQAYTWASTSTTPPHAADSVTPTSVVRVGGVCMSVCVCVVVVVVVCVCVSVCVYVRMCAYVCQHWCV